MKTPVFYLDLDRTVFRTHQAAMFFAALAELYPGNLAVKDGYAAREAYYVFPEKEHGDTKTYYYDLAAQLRAAGLEPVQVFKQLCEVIGDGRFEYEGLHELIAALQARGKVKILTYGEPMYQTFKAALCPSLRGIEVTAMIASKASYLNGHSTDIDWIIDDKIIAGLATGIHTVHIQHDVNNLADAHSLEEVEIIIERAVPLV